MSTESSLVKTLRCSTCGAPLRPSAESILNICSFCGSITAESPISPHVIIKPKDLIPPEGLGQIRKMELILVPFFEIMADVNMEALGYQRRQRTESRTVGVGENRRTETRTITEYRPWRISHQGSHAVRFLARQEVTLFGAGEFISSVTRSIGGEPQQFDPKYIKDLASRDMSNELIALSPEWGQDEAAKKAGEIVYEAAYSHAKSQMHEVFDTRVNFRPLDQPKLLHEPLLLVRRRYRGRMYRAAYHWGSGQLLREERPIKNRGLMLIITLLAFLGAPPLAQVGYNIYDNSNSDTLWPLIVLGILALGLVIAGIVLIVRIYKPHKVYSIGSKVSLFDFQRLSKESVSQLHQKRGRKTKKQPRFCPKCGDPLEPGQGFCEKCGHQLRS